MKSIPIILCAHQRSGTGALESAFENTKKVENYGEVFYPPRGTKMKASNYFFWINEIEPKYKLKRSMSGAEAECLLDDYLRYLDSLTNRPYFLLDIKYNSFHHIETEWHDFAQPPFLLRYAMRKKLPIIHMIRSNLFLQYFSNTYAQTTGEWHREKESQRQEVSININIHHCYEAIRRAQLNTMLFRSYLDNYVHKAELIYEWTFRDNKITERESRHLYLIISQPWVRELETKKKKTNVTPSKVIINKKELQDRFRGSPYEWMISILDGTSIIKSKQKIPQSYDFDQKEQLIDTLRNELTETSDALSLLYQIRIWIFTRPLRAARNICTKFWMLVRQK